MFGLHIILPSIPRLSPTIPLQTNCDTLAQSGPQSVWGIIGAKAASRNPVTNHLMQIHREAMRKGH